MLQLKNLFQVALKSIYKNRMRSLLTSLGIIIGVGAVIIMVAIGEGASANIQKSISSLGTDLLMVFPGASQIGGVSRGASSENRLTFEDVKKLETEATMIKKISSVVNYGVQVIGGGNNWNTMIQGVDPEFLYIKEYKIASGTFFTDRDVQTRKKSAVLGKTVVDELFPNQDPIGQRIRINATPFTVIGVLAEKGQSGMGQDQDDIILAPSTTVLYRLKGGRYIDRIYCSAISSDSMYVAENQLTALLRKSHHIQNDEEDDFTIRNQAEIIEMASSTTRTLTILLGAIAAVSLLVGGIGIMNIMLVSVTERTREIGIRLSIGARGSDILTQFLAESVVLSLIGGVIGVLLALGVAYLISTFSSMNVVIKPLIVLSSFFFAGAVGVFFGFYPARKAAALNPIDALRYE
ncbi:MAG: ABC transporter permease [Candidatus Zhuqueibacterota bacterium]